MIAFGLSDCGQVREINEDSFAFATGLHGFSYAIVADGMGGHQAGEVASQMAVQLIAAHIENSLEDSEPDIEDILFSAIEHANQKIFDIAMNQQSMAGMGTTIVIAVADRGQVYVAHVGDSRLYLLHEETLVQVTEDHSHVQKLVNEGIITAEQARFHSKRNIILRALGTEPGVLIDMQTIFWEPNDVLLLCSDGLNNMLSEEQLRNILMSEDSAESRLQQLIDEANAAGGDDNITAILLCNDQSAIDGKE